MPDSACLGVGSSENPRTTKVARHPQIENMFVLRLRMYIENQEALGKSIH
jgi:hypothetical protein